MLRDSVGEGDVDEAFDEFGVEAETTQLSLLLFDALLILLAALFARRKDEFWPEFWAIRC